MIDQTAARINSLDPRFRPYAEFMVAAAREAGIPLVVISGTRTAAANRAAGGAAFSRHLRGLAFDVQVLGFERDDLPGEWWEGLGLWWESLGGRWGGRFSPPDVNHFDAG